MPRTTTDFSAVDPGSLETAVFTFDFLPATVAAGTMMGAGETIATQVWSIVALNGIDASPSSRLIGAPQILTGTKVLQKIGNCVAGETYHISVTVTTSVPQTLTLFAHCNCATPS